MTVWSFYSALKLACGGEEHEAVAAEANFPPTVRERRLKKERSLMGSPSKHVRLGSWRANTVERANFRRVLRKEPASLLRHGSWLFVSELISMDYGVWLAPINVLRQYSSGDAVQQISAAPTVGNG
jgi:hypothetical protein